MWGLLSGFNSNIKAILFSVAACVIFFAGFHIGNSRYLELEKQVKIEAEKQQAKNESIEKQHALINQGIKNEYEAKLSAVRNFYASGVRNPSSGAMSGISAAPKGTDAETAYPILAGQCAETTAQTIALQDWIKAQIDVK